MDQLAQKLTGKIHNVVAPNDAIRLLIEDHRKIDDLFCQFSDMKDKTDMTKKTSLVRETLTMLKAHMIMEEELFYPTVRTMIDNKDCVMEEADEEHHIVGFLIDELMEMNPADPHYDCKFTLLITLVRAHVTVEENSMLTKVAHLNMNFEQFAQQMKAKKAEIMANMPNRMVGRKCDNAMTALSGMEYGTCPTTKSTTKSTTASSTAFNPTVNMAA